MKKDNRFELFNKYKECSKLSFKDPILSPMLTHSQLNYSSKRKYCLSLEELKKQTSKISGSKFIMGKKRRQIKFPEQQDSAKAPSSMVDLLYSKFKCLEDERQEREHLNADVYKDDSFNDTQANLLEQSKYIYDEAEQLSGQKGRSEFFRTYKDLPRQLAQGGVT